MAMLTLQRSKSGSLALQLARVSDSQAAAFERIAIVLCLFVGAFPLYHRLTRATEALAARSLAIAWDHMLPFWPEWGYVYHFVAFSVLLPVFIVKDRELFRRIGLAAFAVELTTFILFFVFPVRMDRPALGAASSFADWGMHLLYSMDSAYGSFPSLHVSLATLAALSCLSVDVWLGLLAAVIASAIALSTLFVKQHFVLDVVAGTALGALAWALIVAPGRARRADADSSLRYPRTRVLIVFATYAVVLAALYGFYLANL